MSDENQTCPKCSSPYGYLDQSIYVCPECAHEWSLETEQEIIAKFIDVHGVELQSGDTVQVVKDLKVGSNTLKTGTKVKNIRLLDEPVNGHDISCKVDGFGSIYLKCSVVKKI